MTPFVTTMAPTLPKKNNSCPKRNGMLVAVFEVVAGVTEFQGPKRASPRVPVFCPVIFWGAPEQSDAICLNISRGGMALAVDEPIPAGTLLRVSALLPNQDPIAATAVVVWEVRGLQTRVGLRFLSLEQEALTSVVDFMAGAAPA
jgi:hypothetical protein